MNLNFKSLSAATLALTLGTSGTVLAQGNENTHRFSTDRIIISMNSSSNANPASVVRGVTGKNAGLIRRMFNGNAVVRLDEKLSDADMAILVDQLLANPNVSAVEPDWMMQAFNAPNDSQYNNQWHYFEAMGGLNLETAWASATGAGTVVAVLDTGYRPHVDLAANLLAGYDMISDAAVGNDGDGRDSDASDPGDWVVARQCYRRSPASDSSWHGTHVAGTIAAVTNNGSGVAGVAYDAKVVPVRVLGTCGGYTSDIADGIIWAAGGNVSGSPSNPNPAQVINMSLGGGSACSSITQDAINIARGLGATIVVAAGNSDADAANYAPASCNGVVTVAATDRNGGRAYYSNYGSVVDVAAPGGAQSFANDPNGVLSTLNSGTTTPGKDNYIYYQGTSMAAPHVAGVAALMYQLDSSITPDEVESILVSTTRSFPATCGQCGSGIVDAAAAVAAVGGNGGGGTDPDTTAPGAPTGLAATAGDASVALSWAANSESDLAGYKLYRSTTAGQQGTSVAGNLISGTNYSDTGLTNDVVYYYTVTAVDTSANESASSNEANAVPTATTGCVATSMSVSSMIAGADSINKGTKQPWSNVSVVDDCGDAVSGAVVTVDFSGSVNSTGDTGVTAASGTARINSGSTQRGGVNFTACVTDLSGSLSYNAASNTVSCASN